MGIFGDNESSPIEPKIVELLGSISERIQEAPDDPSAYNASRGSIESFLDLVAESQPSEEQLLRYSKEIETASFGILSSEEAIELIRMKMPAPDPDAWSAPIPLTTEITAEPYPVESLPKDVREAVNEVLSFTQAPVPLVVNSAMSAMSLAIQASVDVERAKKLTGPVGLFLLTIADSGERKSTCDNFFTKAIRVYEAFKAEEAKPKKQEYQSELDIWESKRSGLKDKIRQLEKSGANTKAQEVRLLDLDLNQPIPPQVPKLIYNDATPEALKWGAANKWPSLSVLSNEAGIVFGSHGMGKDSVMRNLATLNQFWDGANIDTERKSTESYMVKNARLTIALQVQEATLRNFFDRTDGLPRGTGFLARCLFAWPEPTQGTRFFKESQTVWPALDKFNSRITEILETSEVQIIEQGALKPRRIKFSNEAKAAWVSFHDAIEGELCLNGELYEIRDVASKIADNAARIAALFQCFESNDSEAIELPAFEGACNIATWHLREAKRFFSEIAFSEEQLNVLDLDKWLLDFCIKNNTAVVEHRTIQQRGPNKLRKKSALNDALSELFNCNRARKRIDGKKNLIQINPKLLESPGNLSPEQPPKEASK